MGIFIERISVFNPANIKSILFLLTTTLAILVFYSMNELNFLSVPDVSLEKNHLFNNILQPKNNQRNLEEATTVLQNHIKCKIVNKYSFSLSLANQKTPAILKNLTFSTFTGVWKVDHSSYGFFQNTREGKLKITLSYEMTRIVVSSTMLVEKAYLLLGVYLYDGFYADNHIYINTRVENTEDSIMVDDKSFKLHVFNLVGLEINKYFLENISDKGKLAFYNTHYKLAIIPSMYFCRSQMEMQHIATKTI